MEDIYGIIIEANEDERIMIDFCNENSVQDCYACPYKLQCQDFELIHDTIPYTFKSID